MEDKFENTLNKIFNESTIILDAGARQGSFDYPENARVIFFDNDLDFVPENKKKFIYADCYKLPFKKNKFDVVILKYVLEHVIEPEKVISNSVTVLKRNGYLIITVPKWFSFQELLYRLLGRTAEILGKGKQAHIQRFKFKKICILCKNNNLKLIEHKQYASGLSFLERNETRKKFKKIIMVLINIVKKITGCNLLARGEMYFIFKLQKFS